MASRDFKAVHEHIEKSLLLIERQPSKKLPHPYLAISPLKYYPGIVWLWDHHHAGMRFAHGGRPEYLRHLVDNLLVYQTRGGYVPNVVHSQDGPSEGTPRFHAQATLIQGAMNRNRTDG
ncbi:MAG: hypothetical protein QF577_01075 [Phycisphaerae bacterium]|jgi:hypothetical protein|nr:hypothetical protein [Phycisphaerae bacterium]